MNKHSIFFVVNSTSSFISKIVPINNFFLKFTCQSWLKNNMQSNLIVVHCIWISFFAPVVFHVTNIKKLLIIYSYILKFCNINMKINNYTYIHLAFHLNKLLIYTILDLNLLRVWPNLLEHQACSRLCSSWDKLTFLFLLQQLPSLNGLFHLW